MLIFYRLKAILQQLEKLLKKAPEALDVVNTSTDLTPPFFVCSVKNEFFTKGQVFYFCALLRNLVLTILQ